MACRGQRSSWFGHSRDRCWRACCAHSPAGGSARARVIGSFRSDPAYSGRQGWRRRNSDCFVLCGGRSRSGRSGSWVVRTIGVGGGWGLFDSTGHIRLAVGTDSVGRRLGLTTGARGQRLVAKPAVRKVRACPILLGVLHRVVLHCRLACCCGGFRARSIADLDTQRGADPSPLVCHVEVHGHEASREAERLAWRRPPARKDGQPRREVNASAGATRAERWMAIMSSARVGRLPGTELR